MSTNQTPAGAATPEEPVIENLEELKRLFADAYRVLDAERKMRSSVFRDNTPKRTAKVAEIDRILGVLTMMKDELKRRMLLDGQAEPQEPQQASLLAPPVNDNPFL